MLPLDSTLAPEVFNETLRLLETPDALPSFWSLSPLLRQNVFRIMLSNSGLREGEDWGVREATTAGFDQGEFWTHKELLFCWHGHVWADHLQCWVDRTDVALDGLEEEYRKNWPLDNDGRPLTQELIWTVGENFQPARLAMLAPVSTRWSLELKRQLPKGLAIFEQKAMADKLPPAALPFSPFRL
jgi:hypothetical protein